MPPKISIIILNWNGLEDTIKCLESLKKITYPNYEVVVVDNGSKGNDADVLAKKYKEYIKLIREKKNLGFAEGNNVAIRKVIKEKESKYVFLLNSDTTVEPDFLDKLVNFAERHKKLGSVQPKMVWAIHPHLIDSAGLEYSKTGFGFERGKFCSVKSLNKAEEIFGCCAGACLYRAEALRDIAIQGEYLDKDFFAYYEDFDLAFRLRWAGWQNWYCPQSVIYHFRGASVGTKSKFTAYYGARNQTWNLFKNLPASFFAKNFFFIIAAQIAQIAINLLHGDFQVVWHIIKGRFAGYLGFKAVFAKRKKVKKRIPAADLEKWIIWKWRTKIPKDLH